MDKNLPNFLPGLARLVWRVATAVQTGDIEAVELTTGKAVEVEDLDGDVCVQQTLEVDQPVTSVARWQNLISSFFWAIQGKEGITFCSAA